MLSISREAGGQLFGGRRSTCWGVWRGGAPQEEIYFSILGVKSDRYEALDLDLDLDPSGREWGCTGIFLPHRGMGIAVQGWVDE